MSGPRWDSYAELEGWAYRKQGMQPVVGTLARCATSWLGLAPMHRIDCHIRWGGSEAGAHGGMSAAEIRTYVLAHGLPPGMEAAAGGQPSPERLREIVADRRYEAVTTPLRGPGHTTPPRGS